eukprot:1296901-Amphidinium_carterae.1
MPFQQVVSSNYIQGSSQRRMASPSRASLSAELSTRRFKYARVHGASYHRNTPTLLVSELPGFLVDTIRECFDPACKHSGCECKQRRSCTTTRIETLCKYAVLASLGT